MQDPGLVGRGVGTGLAEWRRSEGGFYPLHFISTEQNIIKLATLERSHNIVYLN